ncbi:hypothetical protein G6F37_009665 [Rhizopus arrhizus]|nr:hypothetical protein G6F38_001958 [Rhizopus arrhizus]KAG1154201.1 hypothetical protein G6F37_009665 [Rhizopus arrhizus]
MSAEEIEVVINHCSVVKSTEAADFFRTYSCERMSLCRKLSGIYVNEAIFNGIKVNYDLSTIQARLTPTSTWCRCKPTTTSNSIPTTTSNNNPTTTGNINFTTTTITSNPTHNNEDKRGVKRILQQLKDEVEVDKTALEDIDTAHLSMKNFGKTCVELYGESMPTPNMHMHLHLKESFLDFGPLYSFWLYGFIS